MYPAIPYPALNRLVTRIASPYVPAHMAQPPILSLEGLGLQQGGRWLFGRPKPGEGAEPIDLHVLPGDRLALIGRNGAGKTTLLRLIDDQIEMDRGTRRVKPNMRIVFLEQEPDFTDYASLMDFALSGTHAPAAHEVESIAGQLGIDMSRDAATASGGEKRRAAIARALPHLGYERRSPAAGPVAALLRAATRRCADQPLRRIGSERR